MISRVTRIPRWAWLASVTLHVLVACLLYVLLPREPLGPDVAAACCAAPQEPFGFAFETPDDVPAPQLLVMQPPPAQVPTATPSPETPVPIGRPPTQAVIPAAISKDLQAKLRDLAAQPSSGSSAVGDELPLPPSASELRPVLHSAVQPAPATVPNVGPPPRAKLMGGRPIHGAMPKEVVTVYLLDGSASMGLNRDTFEAAQRALMATVRGLAPGSRFQVLIYHGTVKAAWKEPPARLLTANEDTFTRLADALAMYTPEGKSGHETGFRAAVQLQADYLIWITDASDEELNKVKRLLKPGLKTVAVYIARARNGTVAEPAEFR